MVSVGCGGWIGFYCFNSTFLNRKINVFAFLNCRSKSAFIRTMFSRTTASCSFEISMSKVTRIDCEPGWTRYFASGVRETTASTQSAWARSLGVIANGGSMGAPPSVVTQPEIINARVGIRSLFICGGSDIPKQFASAGRSLLASDARRSWLAWDHTAPWFAHPEGRSAFIAVRKGSDLYEGGSCR